MGGDLSTSLNQWAWCIIGLNTNPHELPPTTAAKIRDSPDPDSEGSFGLKTDFQIIEYVSAFIRLIKLVTAAATVTQH